MMVKLTPYLFIFLLAACNTSKAKKAYSNQTFNEFKNSLTERNIGNTKLFISLPKNYLIQPAVGEEFSVYYFEPSDTNSKKDFSGEVYFGVCPNEFKPNYENCMVEDLESKILDKYAFWKLYSCNEKCFVQVITDWKEGKDFVKIHAFGYAKNRTDLEKVLYVFSTLKQKN